MAEELKLALSLALLLILMHFSGIGCPIKFLTGVPCAGCGMTRAVVLMLHGEMAEAARFHPLCFIMPPAAALWFFRDRLPRRLLKALSAAFAALFLFIYLFRIIQNDPLLTADLSDGFIIRTIKEAYNVLW